MIEGMKGRDSLVDKAPESPEAMARREEDAKRIAGVRGEVAKPETGNGLTAEEKIELKKFGI